MIPPALAATIVASILVSGCASSAGPNSGDAPETGEGPVLFDDSTGAIAGLVVSEDLLPIEGAVVLLDGQFDTITDVGGRFAFGRLVPRDYEVVVAKSGYGSELVRAEVSAGQETSLTITLRTVASIQAYHELFQQAGIVSCGVSAGTSLAPDQTRQVAVCSASNYAVGDAIDKTVSYFNEYGLNPDVTGFWLETVWTSTQALSNRMAVGMYALDKQGDVVSGETGVFVDGTSPIRVRIPVGNILNATVDDKRVCEDWDCPLEVWHFAWARNTTIADPIVISQQRYTDFLSVFHYGELPLEYTALPDQ